MTTTEIEVWHASIEGGLWSAIGRALARGDNATAFAIMCEFMSAPLAMRCLIEFTRP